VKSCPYQVVGCHAADGVLCQQRRLRGRHEVRRAAEQWPRLHGQVEGWSKPRSQGAQAADQPAQLTPAALLMCRPNMQVRLMPCICHDHIEAMRGDSCCQAADRHRQRRSSRPAMAFTGVCTAIQLPSFQKGMKHCCVVPPGQRCLRPARWRCGWRRSLHPCPAPAAAAAAARLSAMTAGTTTPSVLDCRKPTARTRRPTHILPNGQPRMCVS
jgi:hypothetical protein